MRLLICTQTVDIDDPVLGFFHRWIGEFSRSCETVHVICLREGRHDLPKNVFVHSLGKEKDLSRVGYVLNFYRYAWGLRRDYDAVFVHMNPEYVCLGGFLWRPLGKPIGLWYVHWATSLRLRMAVVLANIIFTAREDSMRIATPKKQVVGHGIDTNAFKPAAKPPRPDSILFLSRLDPVKQPDLFIRALQRLYEQKVPFTATLVGRPSASGTEFEHSVRNLASSLVLEGVLSMQGAVTNEQAQRLFATNAIFCKLSPQGQFDKVLLEAMASGSLVVSTDRSLSDIVSSSLLADERTDDSLARAMRTALELGDDERRAISQQNRTYVVERHSLSRLVAVIVQRLS